MERRTFLKNSSLAAASGLTILNFPLFGKNAPSNKVIVAIMGVNSRGSFHLENFSRIPGVEVAYICDVEDGAIKKGFDAIKNVSRKPTLEKDIRKLVAKTDFDALVIAAPDHWHASKSSNSIVVAKPTWLQLQRVNTRPSLYLGWSGKGAFCCRNTSTKPRSGILKSGNCKQVPAAWDETKLIVAVPGELFVVARRKGEKWYVAGINGKNEKQEIQINLPAELVNPTFIGDGEVPSDLVAFNIGSNISSFSISMMPNGGFVLY